MSEEELQDKIDLIEEDILALIQDEGLTDTRLEQFGPNILALWGVKSVGFVCEEIRSVLLDLMKRDKYGKALTWALGAFTPAAQIDKLTDRRVRLMEESDEFNVSEDTLRRWERRSMKPLARMLVERSERDNVAWSYQYYAEREGNPAEQFDALKAYVDDKIYKLKVALEEADLNASIARDRVNAQGREISELRRELEQMEGKRAR